MGRDYYIIHGRATDAARCDAMLAKCGFCELHITDAEKSVGRAF